MAIPRRNLARMKTLLIDGDIFIYRITAASEIPIEWDNDLWTLHSDLDYCKEALDRQIAEYKEALKADEIVIALSPPTNFRYRIYPAYKSNRKGKRKPITYHPLKNYTISNYITYKRPDIEGDDILENESPSPRMEIFLYYPPQQSPVLPLLMGISRRIHTCMKTLLIDGDIFIYRITAASEIPIEWDNDLWTLHSDLDSCREVLDRQIAEYKEALKADEIVIALSPPTNFRYRIYPQYNFSSEELSGMIVNTAKSGIDATVELIFQRKNK